MKILVTGARGFVGRNLCENLRNIQTGKNRTRSLAIEEIFAYDLDTDPAMLDSWCEQADFVFNLAGVNRPKEPSEFMEGNFGFASTLLDTLRRHGNACPVMLSSSIQATLIGRYGQSDYGTSKLAGENLFFDYGRQTGAPVLVYRFPNLFGKWCRPNYNSVVATFCHNIARGLPIEVRAPAYELPLVYIDDVVACILDAMQNHHAERDTEGYCRIHPVHRVTLGHLAELIEGFSEARKGSLEVPYLAPGSFEKKLYSTYLSYLPTDQFAYDLNMHCDDRGSFTEALRSPERGQVSVNISKPGIVKGNHWHHTKNEKFLVVQGEGVIRFRRIDCKEIIEYHVSGKKLQVVDIPCGYTHNIENVGIEDMVTVMWANECFDPDHPDTFYLPV